jgi:hypothetical protein
MTRMRMPGGWMRSGPGDSGGQDRTGAGPPGPGELLPAPVAVPPAEPETTTVPEAGQAAEQPPPASLYELVYLTSKSEDQTTRVTRMLTELIKAVTLLIVVVAVLMVVIIACILAAVIVLRADAESAFRSYAPTGLVASIGVGSLGTLASLIALVKWVRKRMRKKRAPRPGNDQGAGAGP